MTEMFGTKPKTLLVIECINDVLKYYPDEVVVVKRGGRLMVTSLNIENVYINLSHFKEDLDEDDVEWIIPPFFPKGNMVKIKFKSGDEEKDGTIEFKPPSECKLPLARRVGPNMIVEP